MRSIKKNLSGWSNYPYSNAYVSRPESVTEINVDSHHSVIARGLGRSYGDAALNTNGLVVLTERLNRFLSFDPVNGVVRAECGVTFRDLLETFVPRKWFPSVTPGTKDVTLGGAIAADVHGKNHFSDGSIGRHIQELTILTANAGRQECSRVKNRALFSATIGGMGLTGLILEAKIQLAPIETSWMVVEQKSLPDFDTTLEFFFQNNINEEKYSVAWCDLLATGPHFGRSIAMKGRHASINEVPQGNNASRVHPHFHINLPCNMPSLLLNRFSMSFFNSCYYRLQRSRAGISVIDYESFFYPMDRIGSWNKLYGKQGLLQYQCVLPFKTARAGFKLMLQQISKAHYGAFLAVLKKFGAAGEGLLSFPCEGLSLAIDLPNRGSALMPLLDQLDTITISHGGRTYLAKDSHMHSESFKMMYPQVGEWQKVKAHVDPRCVWDSDLSRRLQLGAWR